MKRVHTAYKQIIDGDVIVIPLSGHYKIVCCDCGLAHNFYFKSFTVPGRKRVRIGFKAYRNNRVTSAIRRYTKYTQRRKSK